MNSNERVTEAFPVQKPRFHFVKVFISTFAAIGLLATFVIVRDSALRAWADHKNKIIQEAIKEGTVVRTEFFEEMAGYKKKYGKQK